MQPDRNKRFSSLRCAPPETTLTHARQWAADAGISRVADISGLDRSGFPVCASIRPRSQHDAVTYGKGLLPIDAEVGAYMEAIEFKWAEPGSGTELVTRWGTPREVAGEPADAILDYCPMMRQRVALDGSLLLVQGHDIETGASVWLPAELVYHPAPEVGQELFGTSTNGLASGNSVLEASLHALTEVIERDIWSFQLVRDTALTLDCSTGLDRSVEAESCALDAVPVEIKAMMQTSARNGLRFIVRYVPNDFALPFFCAYLYEAGNPTNKYFSGGWGCHLHKDIALARAVCEAAQSRVAMIHGARNFAGSDGETDQSRQALVARIAAMLAQPAVPHAYRDVPDVQSGSGLEENWQVLLGCLRKVTPAPVYRVVYTPPDANLHMVRLVVPTLESFTPGRMRVGRRMKAFMEAL